MSFKIKFYETRHKKIIDEFIANLSDRTVAKIFWLFDLLEKYGPELGMPHVRKIGSNLFELRIRKQESIRFLFTLIGKTIIILHGFKKKRNKIHEKDLETAKNRLT
jgi:phage-related protein